MCICVCKKGRDTSYFCFAFRRSFFFTLFVAASASASSLLLLRTKFWLTALPLCALLPPCAAVMCAAPAAAPAAEATTAPSDATRRQRRQRTAAQRRRSSSCFVAVNADCGADVAALNDGKSQSPKNEGNMCVCVCVKKSKHRRCTQREKRTHSAAHTYKHIRRKFSDSIGQQRSHIHTHTHTVAQGAHLTAFFRNTVELFNSIGSVTKVSSAKTHNFNFKFKSHICTKVQEEQHQQQQHK